jgi:hypothetical protein
MHFQSCCPVHFFKDSKIFKKIKDSFLENYVLNFWFKKKPCFKNNFKMIDVFSDFEKTSSDGLFFIHKNGQLHSCRETQPCPGHVTGI